MEKQKIQSGPAWEEGVGIPAAGRTLAAGCYGYWSRRKWFGRPKRGVEQKQQLQLLLPSDAHSQQIEEIVMEWYRDKALTCFSERIAFYAPKLGVAVPRSEVIVRAYSCGEAAPRGALCVLTGG